MGLFDGLDTPKWQQPGEHALKAQQAAESIGRNISGGIRNFLLGHPVTKVQNRFQRGQCVDVEG